ncbi:helix-turn-helix transcriptional regulator [Aureimonas sp. SK2]|uniref:helix-turn-helix domain-containing protein n=1 Tax=Aureimonas sp. SK2 TaxID=3015992 RepID=UPI00244405AD|nr:helix-turn-helix transcriptional regulator [Aureimonas sp. SK2]
MPKVKRRRPDPDNLRDPKDVKLGAILRELRTSRGWTLEAFSKRMGVTYQQIQKYESGTNRVAAATLYRIAQEFAVPIDAFFPKEVLGPDAELEGSENTRTSQALAAIQDQRVRNSMSVLIAALAAQK